MGLAQHDAARERGLSPSAHGVTWCTSHQDGGRPQPGCAQPRSRAATARRSPSGMVRVADRRLTADLCRSLRSARPRRRSTASQRLRDTTPPKSRTAARARFSSSSNRTTTFTCGRNPPASGTRLVGAWSSIHPHTSANASAARSPAVRSSSPVNGLAFASSSEAIASNMAASSNRSFTCSTARPVAGETQPAPPRRWPVVGCFAVLVQHLHQGGAPPVQLGGAVLIGLRGQLLFDPGPLVGGEPRRRPAAQHPGDHLDMPQAGLAGGEHLTGGRQPRREHGAVHAGARTHLLRGHDAAAGLEPLPPHQVAQRRHRGPVTPLGEKPAPLQHRHRVHGHPVQPAAGALTHRDHRQQLRVGTRADHPGQRVSGRHQMAVRTLERGLGHAPSLLERLFDSDPLVAPCGQLAASQSDPHADACTWLTWPVRSRAASLRPR